MVITVLTRNQVTEKSVRGFESHPLRQKTLGIPQFLRNALFFMCVQKRPDFSLLLTALESQLPQNYGLLALAQ